MIQKTKLKNNKFTNAKDKILQTQTTNSQTQRTNLQTQTTNSQTKNFTNTNNKFTNKNLQTINILQTQTINLQKITYKQYLTSINDKFVNQK